MGSLRGGEEKLHRVGKMLCGVQGVLAGEGCAPLS